MMHGGIETAGGDKPPAVRMDQLFTYYDLMATWLGEAVPLYVPLDELQADGTIATYDGLPLFTSDIPEHELIVPGAIITQYEPEAAAKLDIGTGDIVSMTFKPTHYERTEEGSEPELMTPSCTLLVNDPSGKRSDVVCVFAPADRFIDWESRSGPSYMTVAAGEAAVAIAGQLPNLHKELVARGEYPDDPVAHRRERDFARESEIITQSLEHIVQEAAERRLQAAQTCEPIDAGIMEELQYGQDAYNRTYSYVDRDQVRSLRFAIADRLVSRGVSLHVFDEDLVRRVEPAFHNTSSDLRTTLHSVVLKVLQSPVGPVFSFIVSQSITRRDGLHRHENVSFYFWNTSYVRMTSFQEATHGHLAAVRTDDAYPMTPAQLSVFRGLLDWVESYPDGQKDQDSAHE
jgi:hypothetical protein